MGMVVQHNMQAMNANRMLNVTTSAQAKSTEKLSSGYRINRAADDAAGLTISEKMRKQIKGLNQASTNAQDGVSAVQTSEGALTEVHSMLQRMNELATQASNGTNSQADRDAIQAEVEQLTTEIDRVAETTKFNETYLLKGNVDGTTSEVKVAAHDAGFDGKLTDKGNGVTQFALNKKLEDGDTVKIAGKEYTIGTSGKGAVLDKADLNTKTDGYAKTDNAAFTTTTLSVGDSVTYNGETYTLTDKVGVDSIKWAANDEFKIGDDSYKIVANGSTPGAGEIELKNVEDLVNKALADGKQVTASKFTAVKTAASGTGNSAAAQITADVTIVASLEKGEVSKDLLADTKASTIAKAGAGITDTTSTALTAGDSVTIGGKTTTATSGTPTAAKNVYDAINGLSKNGVVKIGSGADAVTYTIVDSDEEVDEDAFKLTKDAILSKIKDGDSITAGSAAGTTTGKDALDGVTVIGDIGGTGTTGDTITAKTAYSLMADELQKASSIGTDKAATVKNDGDGKFTITQGSVEVKDSLAFSLHVGADADMTNKISVNIESMSAAGLGIKGINVSDDTGAAATYAIDAIADAISKVSSQRSALGAVQNRLEHTVNNLDNVSENTQSAESRIRDTDIAKEMVEYSKNNILAQAGQSMLAQAKSSNQGVLSLLQ